MIRVSRKELGRCSFSVSSPGSLRVVQQHDAGLNYPERIRGWYNLAGGGAGFLIVDYDDPRELTAFLQPYMDLMSWDVRAITENNYDQRLGELRQLAGGG